VQKPKAGHTKGQRNKLCSRALITCKKHIEKEKGNLKIRVEQKNKIKMVMRGTESWWMVQRID
jgi:hypothetical protein